MSITRAVFLGPLTILVIKSLLDVLPIQRYKANLIFSEPPPFFSFTGATSFQQNLSRCYREANLLRIRNIAFLFIIMF